MSESRHSLKDLVAVPGAINVLSTQFLMATGSNMTMLAMTLLVLHEFDSPALAGLVALLANIGIFAAPFAGTILDAYGRKKLILVDFAVTIGATTAIAVLALEDNLSRNTLLVLSAIAGTTTSFSSVGLRTALPAVVPAGLLDMATGMTFNARAAARVFAPLVPGFVAAFGDPAWSLFVCVALYAVAAAVMFLFRDVKTQIESHTMPIVEETMLAVRLNFTERRLRRVAAFNMVAFFGWGFFYGAMAPLIENTLELSAAIVGIAMMLFGLADVAGGLITSHRDTRNREWRYLALGGGLASLGLLACASAWLPLILVGAALIGFAETPVDHVIHVIRQRSIDPKFLGRIVAIGSSISSLSAALGVAAAGFISNTSPSAAFAIGGAIVATGALLPIYYKRSDKTASVRLRADGQVQGENIGQLP